MTRDSASSEQTKNGAGLRRRKTILYFIAAMLLVTTADVWVVSGGSWVHWPTYTNKYAELAGDFLHGQLSLAVAPAPALLALPDPYDPRADAPYRLHDAVLFNGKYYYYWGPVPAIIVAAVSGIFGATNPQVGDQYLAFGFAWGTVLVAGLLIFGIHSKLFPDAPSGAAAIVSLGLGTPMLFTLAGASVYEAAIFAGQFFLMAGLWAAFMGLRGGRAWWLGVAGGCWALAAGSRVSLPPAVAAISLLTVWHLWRRRSVAGVVCLLVPLAAGAILLGWYNHARFGSVMEFGLRYQLVGRDRTSLSGSGFWSAGHVLPNLTLYLLRPPGRWHTFPYLVAMDGRPWLHQFFRLSPYVVCQPLVGLMWTQPFLIFALVGVVGVRGLADGSEEKRLMRWLITGLSASVCLAMAAPMTIDYSAMRYLVDGVPCATVLAALGYWRMRDAKKGREVWLAARICVGMQAVAGVLIAASDHPDLFAKAAAWLPRF